MIRAVAALLPTGHDGVANGNCNMYCRVGITHRSNIPTRKPACSAMRARGTQVTDIAILVVAADDGVMPQTREAIRHARAARCALLVALTKCDRDNAQPERVEAELAAEGLELESVGGSVQVVRVAAPRGVGLRELEEAILLQADLLEVAAPVDGRAEGTVVEAHVERGQGPVATVVVNGGTLRVGEPLVVGKEHGRVRQLRTTDGKEIDEATPGAVVVVLPRHVARRKR